MCHQQSFNEGGRTERPNARTIFGQTREALSQLRTRILGNGYLRPREVSSVAPATRIGGIQRDTRSLVQSVMERGIESGAKTARAFTQSNLFRRRIAPMFAANEARLKMAVGQTESRRELPPEQLRAYHQGLLHAPGQPEQPNQVFEYFRGSGPEPHTVQILAMGNRQSFGTPENGMRELQQRFAARPGVDVLLFRSGRAAADFRAASSGRTDLDSGNTAVNVRHIENIVHDRIHCRGMFANERPPARIGMAGFSWGGGVIDDISQRWDQMRTQIPVTDVVLIDPIQLGLQNLGQPVTRRPAMAGRVLHFYQDSNLSSSQYSRDTARRSISVHGAPLANPRPGDSVRLIRNAGHREIQTARLHGTDVLEPAFQFLGGQQA